jgi:zinc protease
VSTRTLRCGARSAAWRTAGLAALFAIALGFTAPAARAMSIEAIKSPGGIEAWLVRASAVPIVAINFAFRGGSSQDPAGKPGVANLITALLDEGAGKYDSRAFHQQLDERAVDFRFSAGRDFFRGSMRVLRDNRDEGFELLRLMLEEPRFDAAAVERMRAQLTSDLKRESNRPAYVASLAWWAAAFPDHPYGRPERGTPETLAKITVDDLKSYHRHVFARDGLKVALVGDIDAAAAGKLLDSVFGALPAKGELTPVPDVAVQGIGGRILRDLDVPQASMVFGGSGLARSDPDFMAAYIVNYVLGGGSFSSRLYNEVREKRGLAYSIYQSLVWLEHAAATIGGTATRSGATASALAIVEQEINRMREQGPTADELAKAKSFLKGSYALNLDTSTKIAAQLVQIQIDNLGIDYIERRDRMIDAVTLDDARRVAKRLFEGGILVAIAGRPQGLTPKSPGN